MFTYLHSAGADPADDGKSAPSDGASRPARPAAATLTSVALAPAALARGPTAFIPFKTSPFPSFPASADLKESAKFLEILLE